MEQNKTLESMEDLGR